MSLKQEKEEPMVPNREVQKGKMLCVTSIALCLVALSAGFLLLAHGVMWGLLLLAVGLILADFGGYCSAAFFIRPTRT